MSTNDVEDVYFDASRIEVVPPVSLTSEQVSSNSIGNALTILFDGGKVSLQGGAEPLSTIWVGRIQVPVSPKAGNITSYLQHIRGALEKTESAQVSLIFEAGGKRFVTEFPCGTPHEGELMLEFISPLTPGTREHYIATIVLLVERKDANSAVLVSIDSLDVQATTG